MAAAVALNRAAANSDELRAGGGSSHGEGRLNDVESRFVQRGVRELRSGGVLHSRRGRRKKQQGAALNAGDRARLTATRDGPENRSRVEDGQQKLIGEEKNEVGGGTRVW